MKLTVDLNGCVTERQVLHTLGEVFAFGGPGGNIPAKSGATKGWGMNWNALYDSLKNIEHGGMWATSPKFSFPLDVSITNSAAFKKSSPAGFKALQEILGDHKKMFAEQGKRLTVTFS